MSELLTPGMVFAGRYRLAEPIGMGGFGAVYAAEHLVTQRRVAMKTLWPAFAKQPEFRERFTRECRVAAQIGGDYVVDVLDAGVDDTTEIPFLVMELLRGESLDARVSRKGRFAPEEVIVYLSQVAVALDRTHARNVVHRDLKPGNLFLTERSDGTPLVKILDFGIAKVIADSGFENVSQTVGTPLYMAPEQFNFGAITGAADIYALAMIAFRFLVGAHYFRAERDRCENVYQLGNLLGRGPSEAATVRARSYGATWLPADFDAWFAHAAHPVAGERYPSAIEAVRQLGRVTGVGTLPLLEEGHAPEVAGALSFAIDSLSPRKLRGSREVSDDAPTRVLERKAFRRTAPLAPSADSIPTRVTADLANPAPVGTMVSPRVPVAAVQPSSSPASTFKATFSDTVVDPPAPALSLRAPEVQVARRSRWPIVLGALVTCGVLAAMAGLFAMRKPPELRALRPTIHVDIPPAVELTPTPLPDEGSASAPDAGRAPASGREVAGAPVVEKPVASPERSTPPPREGPSAQPKTGDPSQHWWR
ncbi:MAG: protein kinase [Polyangiaceae bacterium]